MATSRLPLGRAWLQESRLGHEPVLAEPESFRGGRFGFGVNQKQKRYRLGQEQGSEPAGKERRRERKRDGKEPGRLSRFLRAPRSGHRRAAAGLGLPGKGGFRGRSQRLGSHAEAGGDVRSGHPFSVATIQMSLVAPTQRCQSPAPMTRQPAGNGGPPPTRIGAARLGFAGAGRPVAAAEPLEANPAKGSCPGSWWRSERAREGGRSELGSLRAKGGPRTPGSARLRKQNPPPSNFSSGRRSGLGWPGGRRGPFGLAQAAADPRVPGRERLPRRRRARAVGLPPSAFRAPRPAPGPPARGQERARRRAEPARGRGPGGARSPRSSSPSLNWPLWLIRSCRPSSGCSGSGAGELSGLGAVAKGAWPRGGGGGGGTAGPGGLRRWLPAAGSMARGGGSRRRRRAQRRFESEPRGAAARSGRRGGGRAGAAERRCAGGWGAGAWKRRARRAAGGGGWGRGVAAALRPPGAGAGGRDPPRGPGAGARRSV